MKPAVFSLTFGLIFGAGSAALGDLEDPVPLAPESIQAFRPVQRAIPLPVEISRQQAIFVQARLNGSQPLWFLLDSASSPPVILEEKRAAELRLPADARGPGLGAGERPFEVTYSRGVSLSVAGLELGEQTVAATSLEQLGQYAGRTLDGILGYELFRRYVVEVQYSSAVVNLYEPDGYRYDGPGQILPATLDGKHFCIRVRITLDGTPPLEAKLLVDTGAGHLLTTLNAPYVDLHRLAPRDWTRHADRLQMGLGGQSRLFAARARALELGGFVFHDVPIEFSRDEKGLMASPDFDGILGGQMLRRFKVVFDHARQRIILDAAGIDQNTALKEVSAGHFAAI